VIWLVLGGACLIVGAVYGFMWPRPRAGATRPLWRHILLRLGHTAVWLLLATSFFMRGVDGGQPGGGQANILALAAGLLYAVFIATAVGDRMR
jgi:hypothetical protein